MNWCSCLRSSRGGTPITRRPPCSAGGRGVLDRFGRHGGSGATGGKACPARYGAAQLDLHPNIRLFPPAIPENRSSTAETRAVLPTQVPPYRCPVQPQPCGDACGGPHSTARSVVGGDRGPAASVAAGASMPASAEYLATLRRLNIPAVLSGAGPAVIALTNGTDLPAQALEFGAAKGFAVTEMSVGHGVRWSPGIAGHAASG